MGNITKLTPDQERELVDTCNRWLAVGRSTKPLDRVAAAQVIGEMYREIGEVPPTVLVFSSPLMCVLAYGVLSGVWGQLRDQLDQLRGQLRGQLRDQLWGQLRGQLRDQLWDQLWDQLRDQLWGQLGGQLWDQLGGQLRGQLRDQLGGQLRDQLWDQLRGQLWGQLGGQLRDQLRGQLRDQLWDQLRDQLWDQLGGQLRGQLRDQLWDQLWDQLGGQLNNLFCGQHDCAWEVFYDFCRRIGVNYRSERNDALLTLWLQQSESCHWWWPYKGVVLASGRHNVLSLDEHGRLHSLTGPAVAYPDGWGVYAVHGVRVPADVIEHRKGITVERIDQERNAEIRRVLLELYGQSRYLQDSGAREVQRDDYGALYCRELSGDEPLVMVCLVNSTPEPDGTSKIYWLRVPPTIRTAREAVAWTFGMERAADYEPVKQT